MRLSNAYLVAYNIFQLQQWTIVLICVFIAQIKDLDDYDNSAYLIARPYIEIAQGGAVLEVLHAASGLVKGSPAMAFLQWFGRANILFAILRYIPEVQIGWPVSILFIAWSIADIIRYPYYIAVQLGEPPKFLTYLRYTAFILLYPLGIASEVVILVRSLPYLRERGIHSISLPNWFNFGFSYWIFTLVGLIVLYPVACPYLFSNLLQQRKRRFVAKPVEMRES